MNFIVEKCYNVDSDRTYWLSDSDGELVAKFYDDSVFDFVNAAEHSVHLTALRRGLALSLLFNVVLLAVVLAIIGGR
jgi:hypothetical protein